MFIILAIVTNILSCLATAAITLFVVWRKDEALTERVEELNERVRKTEAALVQDNELECPTEQTNDEPDHDVWYIDQADREKLAVCLAGGGCGGVFESKDADSEDTLELHFEVF